MTPKQKEQLKKHSVQHTAKHMSTMKKEMSNGKTFSAAHKIAMKKAGK